MRLLLLRRASRVPLAVLTFAPAARLASDLPAVLPAVWAFGVFCAALPAFAAALVCPAGAFFAAGWLDVWAEASIGSARRPRAAAAARILCIWCYSMTVVVIRQNDKARNELQARVVLFFHE